MVTEQVSEDVEIAVSAQSAFDAVAALRFVRWSPECFAVWVWRRDRDGHPVRFVGWNRRGPFVWFTTCTVVASTPAEEFSFDVTTFGMPVARWTYRFAALPGDGARVTEEWTDRRGRGAWILGRVFTGRATKHRPEVNREGMRATLQRLKQELEG
ncbi:MAG TPA: SRPBCC family protein [Candidatus Limnocylindrales bacterium]|nr:SRPBCC family protein [Candidatus Limnocylindrales bacterium]